MSTPFLSSRMLLVDSFRRQTCLLLNSALIQATHLNVHRLGVRRPMQYNVGTVSQRNAVSDLGRNSLTATAAANMSNLAKAWHPDLPREVMCSIFTRISVLSNISN